MNHIKLILPLLLSLNVAWAQKTTDFEGIIKFKIEYSEMDEALAPYAAMMPKDILLKIKGEFSRVEQSMGMAGSTIVITNQKNKKTTTLMDVMGSKYKMTSVIEDDSENNNAKEEYDIVYLKETKEIAGYTCKKAEIHHKNSEEVLTLYYTEELSSEYLPNKPKEYNGINGFPMEYELAQENMRMTIAVSEIKKEKISSSEFEAPADYKETTQEELMKIYGGGK